ncbi:MAG: SSS family solute:sodium symporter [Idiomarinaceae bacterium HL-53]|nr:MAG: SSS family solute:sodium symporter [Idiomarinaceae bacterium HL-53]CUS47100.1 Na+/proline symporter [Idiomarinaceae bacterium HL-53]
MFWALLFFTSIAGITFWQRRKAQAHYLTATHELGFWPVMGSVVATNVGAAVLIGAVARGYDSGFGFAWVLSSQALFVALLVWKWLPVIHQHGVRSVPTWIAQRFSAHVAFIPSLVCAFVLMVPVFAMQLVGMAGLLSTLTPLSFATALLFAALPVTLFTLMSGMRDVAYTDMWQTLWIIVGFLALSAAVYNFAPLDEPAASATPLDSAPLSGMPLLNLLVLFGPFYLIWQTTWQRITASRSVSTARRAVLWGWVLTFGITLVCLWLGKQALPMGIQADMPDQVLGLLITQALAPQWAGLLWGALFAAMFTGATSFLLSGASNVVFDLVPGLKLEAEYKSWFTKGVVLLLALVGAFIALTIQDIFQIYYHILALTTVALLWTVVASMSKRYRVFSHRALVLSQVLGLLTAVLWVVFERPWQLNEIIPGLLVGAVVLVAAQFIERQLGQATNRQ